MRVLIVTQCTGEKAVRSPDALTIADFRRGPEAVARRHGQLASLMLPAERMYTGEQHRRLLRGLERFRGYAASQVPRWSAELWIVSAGYGLIAADQPIAPYDCTFSGMRTSHLDQWARALRIPERVRHVLAQPYDLGIVLLGDAYLRTCALDEGVQLGGPTLVFAGRAASRHVPRVRNLTLVSLSEGDTRRFGAGHVALKGELAARLLTHLIRADDAPDHLLDGQTDVLDLLARGHVLTRRRRL